ncbi:flavohemoprotein [Pullulanibacillus camelliae]|uniref:Flavohemoprotein n=1 Tax=Pullulanibacillus camelliae TaxID=1707096 RepID=A0A8J2YMJ1_9BACL|nr:NO-inducible flavohemoprotein [Pullulanibacillus camelliae]GGE53173.1 flavohemoprotein [Pullulanibacillus camelliae]
MLNQETIDIIKSTVPVLEQHGTDITKAFYKRMFKMHPELKNVFNQTNQKKNRQQEALANVVYHAAKHIDELHTLAGVVEGIAHKHRSIGIRPDQYPIVGENLLAAIKEVLGEAATDEIINAWAEAYGELAKIFIGEENALREGIKERGGWDDYKPFIVARKVPESEVITSFYLKPQDGRPLPTYSPGQYLSVRVQPTEQANTQIRQYSLSDAYSPEYYRISVKREAGREGLPDGIVSTYLHHEIQEGDCVWVSAPAGEFTLNLESKKPIVLISGGVGLTPLTSMAKTWKQQGAIQNLTWIHAAINGSVHALKEEMRTLDKENDTFKCYTVYERPTEEDRENKAFDKEGYIDLLWLKQVLDTKEAEFYFCGPEPFMKAIYNCLLKWGVQESSIHFEFFGPSMALEEEVTA